MFPQPLRDRLNVKVREWIRIGSALIYVHAGWRNPSRHKGDDRLPVENVSWNEAQLFVNKLRQATGKPWQLPTEAQWEYACRAGTSSPWWCGATIVSLAACANVADVTAANKVTAAQAELVLGSFYALMLSWAHDHRYPLRRRALAAPRTPGTALQGFLPTSWGGGALPACRGRPGRRRCGRHARIFQDQYLTCFSQ